MFMTGPAFWVAPAGGATDPNIADVFTLIHFNDSNGTTIPVASVGSPTITNSNTTDNYVTSSSPQFGAGCWRAGGSGGLQVEVAIDSATPYTLEFFFKPLTFGSFGRFFAVNADSTGNLFAISFAGGSVYYVDSSGSNAATTGSVSIGTWYHMAICYAGGSTVRIYLNGTKIYDGASGSIGMSSTTARVGFCRSVGLGGSDCTAFFDEFRWTHGTDRYPSGLTTPTAEFPDS